MHIPLASRTRDKLIIRGTGSDGKKKKIPRPINFDKYRKNSAINGVFTNSRSNICQKISLKFLILRCEWKLILIMFHSCLSLQIRTWKNIEIKKIALTLMFQVGGLAPCIMRWKYVLNLSNFYVSVYRC